MQQIAGTAKQRKARSIVLSATFTWSETSTRSKRRGFSRLRTNALFIERFAPRLIFRQGRPNRCAWDNRRAGMTVADRQEIILDIFGARAQTREARIQVDLARMEYSLPRLTRAWSHLGQQGGGIGAKGEGESQLEQDKRKIRLQIDRLKRELTIVRSSRATQRKDRKRAPVPNAAIVGYTNVGKSSLLRRLTGADVLIENKLFATLDTTTRKIALPNKQPLLLTDTVGFVRRLPHGLVEAFRATLEEATQADFLIHLLDA